MISLNRAEQTAKEITDLLQQKYPPTKELKPWPEAGVVPSGQAEGHLFLVVNVHINHAIVSLPVLWELTVPLLRYLPTEKLTEFWSVWVQVSVRYPDGNFDRVLRVVCLTDELANLRATRPSDLLDPAMWDEGKSSCYWYWDTQRLSGT